MWNFTYLTIENYALKRIQSALKTLRETSQPNTDIWPMAIIKTFAKGWHLHGIAHVYMH